MGILEALTFTTVALFVFFVYFPSVFCIFKSFFVFLFFKERAQRGFDWWRSDTEGLPAHCSQCGVLEDWFYFKMEARKPSSIMG